MMSLLLYQYLQCTHALIKETADFFKRSQIISWKEYLDKRGVSDLTGNTVCPTRYRTRHFFNNSNTNEDIATKFEHIFKSIGR